MEDKAKVALFQIHKNNAHGCLLIADITVRYGNVLYCGTVPYKGRTRSYCHQLIIIHSVSIILWNWWIKVNRKLYGTVPYFQYNIVSVHVLRKVVAVEYLIVPMSVYQCRSMRLFVTICIEMIAFDIYNAHIGLFVERCINGISHQCSEKWKIYKIEVQFSCVSSIAPQFYHHFLL
jgi:hypothetical protein